jgi:hypothetical protein
MRTLLTGSVASLLAVLVAQASARAGQGQKAPAARITGRVCGGDGKPWAGATVIVRPSGPGSGEKVQRVTSDERGSFEVAARPLHSYLVFAHTAVRDARYRVTSSQTATAGARVLLHEQGERTQLAVRVHGLEAWRDAKLRFFHVEEVVPDAEGRFVLPPHAEHSTHLSIVDESGIVVHMASFLESSTDAVWDLELPPPREAVFRVVDADGQPIAGATLELGRWGGARRAIDADGLRILVPAKAIDAQSVSLATVQLNVAAPGRTSYGASWQGAVRIDAEGRVQLTVPMQPGCSWSGRLLVGPDRPARGARLLQAVTLERTWETNRESGVIGSSPRTLVTDDAGRFTTLGCRASASALAVEIDDSLAAIMPRSADYPTAPLAYLRSLARMPVPPATPCDLGDLRLDLLLPLDIDVVHADGAPARHASLVLAMDEGMWDKPCLVTNERGRLRVFVMRHTRKLAMAARVDSDIGTLDCSVDRAQRLTLRLEPRLWISGTVRNSDRQPMRDVWLFVNFAGDGANARERLAISLAQRGATTDAAGRFHIGTLAAGSRVDLYCTHGTWGIVHTESLSLADKPMSDVEIVLPTGTPVPPVKR